MKRRLPRAIPIVPVLANLARARARDHLAPEQTEQVQAGLLRALVRHAYDNVPYYRDRLDAETVRTLSGAADLHRLPVLARSDLNASGPDQLLADGFTPANTRAGSTGGSTGQPVTLYYSEHDLSYLRATFLWDMLACGMRPFDRIGYLRVGGFRRHRLERLGLARNVHINTSLGVDEQVATFLAGRPTLLYGFPSALTAIVAELRRRNIRPTWVHTVIFAGESMAAEARAEALDYLGATAHEVYASVEAYTIARTCPKGALHLRSADVAVEVLHDDGSVSVADGEGEILVTRLHAQAMPLLRYRLGDRVWIGPNDCSCGVRSTPIVRAVPGRVVDRIHTRDGRVRNGDFLTTLIKDVPGIRQVQIQHHRAGVVEVVVVPSIQAPADLTQRLHTALAVAAPDFQISVRLTDVIEPEANGKIRSVKVIAQ